jgi:hypothetical protein
MLRSNMPPQIIFPRKVASIFYRPGISTAINKTVEFLRRLVNAIDMALQVRLGSEVTWTMRTLE